MEDLSHVVYEFSNALDPDRIIRLPAATFNQHNATAALQQLRVSGDELGYLFRASRDMPYCEGRYGGVFYGGITQDVVDHFPERGSVLSAPFILLCGLHIVLTWRHDSGLLHVIGSLFVVNGIAAFAAHWGGVHAWHNFDAKSMLLAVWLALGYLLSELFENLFHTLGLRGRYATCVRATASAVTWTSTLLIYWWVAETNMAVGQREIGTRVGAIATAAPLVISVISMSCIWGCCAKSLRAHMGGPAFRMARCRFVYGFFVALIGATCWILTENLCDANDAVGTLAKWFPGHFVWHLAMSYGMLQCLLFGGALRADNFNCDVEIDCGTPGGCFRPYFYLFPRLLLTPRDDRSRLSKAAVAPEPHHPAPAYEPVVSFPGSGKPGGGGAEEEEEEAPPAALPPARRHSDRGDTDVEVLEVADVENGLGVDV